MTTPPGGTAGLLDEIESFLQREWRGTLHDGYYIVKFWPPAVARYRAAAGETSLDQLPGRKAIFELAFRDSRWLWLVALGSDPGPHVRGDGDPGPYVRGPQRADQRGGWTQPDWLGPVYHTLYAIEAAPSAFDIGAMIEVAITGLHSFTFIDPDRRLGFQPGGVSYPARLAASSRDDLDPIIANGPTGDWS
jgi:hypothetical protein